MRPLLEKFIHNHKIKVYAFVVSVIVWGVILGQKPVVLTKEVPVQYLLNQTFSLEKQVQDKVSLTLEGKKSSLRSFDIQLLSPTVDLRNKKVPGVHRVRVQIPKNSLPLGVKVLSMKPQFIETLLKTKRLQE